MAEIILAGSLARCPLAWLLAGLPAQYANAFANAPRRALAAEIDPAASAARRDRLGAITPARARFLRSLPEDAAAAAPYPRGKPPAAGDGRGGASDPAPPPPPTERLASAPDPARPPRRFAAAATAPTFPAWMLAIPILGAAAIGALHAIGTFAAAGAVRTSYEFAWTTLVLGAGAAAGLAIHWLVATAEDETPGSRPAAEPALLEWSLLIACATMVPAAFAGVILVGFGMPWLAGAVAWTMYALGAGALAGLAIPRTTRLAAGILRRAARKSTPRRDLNAA